MPKVLRPLALGNLAVAVLFGLPLLVWVAAHYVSRGSLEVTPPAASTKEQTISRIRSYTSIDDVQREALALAEMRAFAQLHSESQSRLVDLLFQWFWAILGIASAAFLTNAGVLYWAHLKVPRAL
jgi:hypothetical protein